MLSVPAEASEKGGSLMPVLIIATICIGDVCRDELVTSSRLDPNVSMQLCSNAAQPQLTAWLDEHWPGYQLAGWKCQLGERGDPV
jgi:hypothetical protein